MTMNPHLWLLRLISKIVPERFRHDWKHEWEAELRYRELRGRRGLLRRSASSFWDAIAMQPRRLEDEMFQDLRQGFRLLITNKGFTLLAVLSIALGVGANTAIFSVIHALVFEPLPYTNPDELVAVVFETPDRRVDRFWPYPKFQSLREQQSSFESTTVYTQESFDVIAGDEPVRTKVELVEAGYFQLLGLQPFHGRVLITEKDEGDGALIIIGFDFWQRHYGKDSQVLGKAVSVNGLPFVIVGIMPEGVRGQAGTAEMWTPLKAAVSLIDDGALKSNSWWWLRVIARLKPGVTLAQARADMLQISPGVDPEVTLSKNVEQRITAVSLKESKVDPEVRRSFVILLGAVGFVLLIACANTAHLLLSRAVTRQKEFAVRVALGGGRFRLARQVLTESLLLAFIGAGAGLLVAVRGMLWLTTAKPWNTVGFWSQYAQTFDYFNVGLDWSVLLFNFVLALATGLLFGLAPAFQASRTRVTEMLKEEAGSSASGFRSLRRPGFRSFLVIAEIALSLVLLAGAGLMIKSFAQITSVNLGFNSENLMTLRVGADRRPPEFYEELADQMKSIPGVQSAAMAYAIPITGSGSPGRVKLDDPDPEKANRVRAIYNVVTADYFRTLGIAVRKGRTFTDKDRIGAPRVAIVNRAMAESTWPGIDPIGMRVGVIFRTTWTADPWIQVVGVVDDVKYGLVEDPFEPALYLPASQPLGLPRALTLAPEWLTIRTSMETASIVGIVRNRVRAMDKTIPLYDVRTMSERAALATSRYRFGTLLMILFAGLALILSAIGVYGVMSHSVSQRTRELGIRAALGAEPFQLFKLILKDAAALIVIGLILGLALAAGTTRILTSQLYNVRPTDPATFAAFSLLLAIVALAACYFPVRRATKLDAIDALRR